MMGPYLQISRRESVRQVQQMICNLQEVFRVRERRRKIL